MKKNIQALIIALTMLLSINGVKAVAGDGGEYSGSCTVKEQYTTSCVYSCTISSDDSHLYFDYKVVVNATGALSHNIVDESVKTDGTIFGTNSKEFLVVKKVEHDLIDYPVLDYFVDPAPFACRPVIPNTKITHESHTSGSGMTTFSTTHHEISIKQDPSYVPENTDSDVVDTTCGILGGKTSKVVAVIQKVYKYLKIIIPVLIVVLSIADFIKVIGTGKDDDMKKAINKFVKRIIIAIVFVLVPLLISIVINISGLTSQYSGINDGLKAIFCILK